VLQLQALSACYSGLGQSESHQSCGVIPDTALCTLQPVPGLGACSTAHAGQLDVLQAALLCCVAVNINKQDHRISGCCVVPCIYMAVLNMCPLLTSCTGNPARATDARTQVSKSSLVSRRSFTQCLVSS